MSRRRFIAVYAAVAMLSAGLVASLLWNAWEKHRQNDRIEREHQPRPPAGITEEELNRLMRPLPKN